MIDDDKNGDRHKDETRFKDTASSIVSHVGQTNRDNCIKLMSDCIKREHNNLIKEGHYVHIKQNSINITRLVMIDYDHTECDKRQE